MAKNVQKESVPEEKDVSLGVLAPRLYVYKTKNDYYSLVPVSLSADKKSIVSYPHPRDLKIDGKFAYPVKLRNGYYLDVKGIDKNVAFLKITYEDYAKLSTPPSIIQLKELILDSDPLLELWDCGIKANDPEEIQKISQWIVSNKLVENAIRIK
jgi:hypothetical protein